MGDAAILSARLLYRLFAGPVPGAYDATIHDLHEGAVQ